jgi:hypothetical protein
MNSSGKDDKFAIYVPEDEEQKRMPDRLELVDPPAGGKKSRLQGGAYDPYQKQDAPAPGDTARIRRPRVDLRQLSEWIKTTQRVKSLREEDLAELEKASKTRK